MDKNNNSGGSSNGGSDEDNKEDRHVTNNDNVNVNGVGGDDNMKKIGGSGGSGAGSETVGLVQVELVRPVTL